MTLKVHGIYDHGGPMVWRERYHGWVVISRLGQLVLEVEEERLVVTTRCWRWKVSWWGCEVLRMEEL